MKGNWIPTLTGTSRSSRRLAEQIRRAASASRTTVLLTGESGTGKELAARAIHRLSPRASGPFVAFNCAGIDGDLAESELFGHARGAFTGAVQKRIGLFEAAAGGTVFLDEIGEAPLRVQAKLLRAIQEREIRRVGENCSIPVDVRIISATNRDLEQEVSRGSFREDLFFRISVVRLHMPSLKERIEDIPLLAGIFLCRVSAELGRNFELSADAERFLCSQQWPGNIRELENAVERAAVMAPPGTHVLTAKDFCEEKVSSGLGGGRCQTLDSFKRNCTAVTENMSGIAASSGKVEPAKINSNFSRDKPEEKYCSPEPIFSLASALFEAEHRALKETLEKSGGSAARAASALQISPSTLWRKLRRHGIRY